MRTRALHRILLGLSMIAAGLSISARAGDYQPLEGAFMVGGATMIDPPEDEPQDTHFYLYLTGHSAKALFDMLQVPAEYDECLDDGSRTKIVENMHCTVSGDETSYECHFAIDVGEQKIVLGSVC